VGTDILIWIYEVQYIINGAHGSVVVRALCYKPEGHRFNSQRGHCIFSIYLILPAALGPAVY
jgi:hypothetical protein